MRQSLRPRPALRSNRRKKANEGASSIRWFSLRLGASAVELKCGEIEVR